MQFETSATPWIRPSVGPSRQPAYATAPGPQQAAMPEPIGETGAGGGQPRAVPTEEYGFADLIDVINPLQHIPVVSNLYREMTGDEISAPARIIGGYLFGGPIGFVASAANAIIEEATGRDLGEAAMAAVFGEDTEPSVAATGVQSAALETEAEPDAGLILGALPSPKASGFRAPPPPDLADEPAVPAPVAPESQTVLTGDAALEALAADLGSQPAPPPAEPAMASLEAVETAAGVPANLVGIGSRDRRGLGPIQAKVRMPMPTDRLPNRLPGAAAAPTGQPMIDAVPSSEAGLPGNPDFSVQLMDALKKYETMMQQRKSGS